MAVGLKKHDALSGQKKFNDMLIRSDTVPELDRWMDLLKQYHALHAFYADAQ